MKRFLLPETAYKCEGPEIVLGNRFEDGELVVTNDVADLIRPGLVNFYGVTEEDVPEVVAETTNDDASLTASNTKK